MLRHLLLSLLLLCQPPLDDDPVDEVFESFRAQALKIGECESNLNPLADKHIMINGVQYRVIGWLQILIDRSTIRLIDRLGYTVDDLFDIEVSLRVAYEWDKLTGGGWRMWECRYVL
ncbi:MAG: hypothetical protein JW384_03855 [Nitrosomonadaceae bacterium]|nr:hypothetical protein [Nitrosomonadaceae bacterium]